MAQEKRTKTKIPKFINQLLSIFKNPQSAEALHWNQDGDAIVIESERLLVQKYLPQYFSHSNMSSFVRQLNIYGFRKIDRPDSSVSYSHRDFLEFSPQNYNRIVRVTAKKKSQKDNKRKPPITESEKVMKEIKQLKERWKKLTDENAILQSERQKLQARSADLSKEYQQHWELFRSHNNEQSYLASILECGKKDQEKILHQDRQTHAPRIASPSQSPDP